MKNEIDNLMAQENLDAIWISGPMRHNPDMVYFTGIHHVNNADLFKIRDRDPILYYFVDMEREEAEKTGLKSVSYGQKYPLSTYLEKTNGDYTKSVVMRLSDILIELGLEKGRVAILGVLPFNYLFTLVETLKQILPELDWITELKDTITARARMTKDNEELERIKHMGNITVEVVSRVQSYLQSQKVMGETVVHPDGTPIQVQDMKRMINIWLLELGAENTHETIFSIGRDGGIPHNSGNPGDSIPLGVPIVFDIFPQEAGGGYFYDFTRTWCLDHASASVETIHNHVLTIHDAIISDLRSDTPFKAYQEKACQLFSELGYPTIADDAAIQEGYIHSVGHGIGLNIHEKPFSGSNAAPQDVLIPGVAFTIEPGLYFPSQNMGVRIEDTIYLDYHGKFQIPAEYPYDLVIPMK